MEKRFAEYAAKFLLLYALFTLVLFAVDWTGLENVLAGWVGSTLHLPVLANQIRVGKDFFAISESCTGLASLSVWLAVVLPLKQPKGAQKLKWIVSGGIALLAINVGRLLFVVQSGKWFGIQLAEWAHIASWFAMSALIIAFWFYGLKKSGIDIAKAF